MSESSKERKGTSCKGLNKPVDRIELVFSLEIERVVPQRRGRVGIGKGKTKQNKTQSKTNKTGRIRASQIEE